MGKNVTLEQLDQAVKASYSLGLIDGNREKENQLNDMRRQLGNMLTTNKELLHPIKKGSNQIKLSATVVRRILSILKKLVKKSSRVEHQFFMFLKNKYEVQTGKKFIFKEN